MSAVEGNYSIGKLNSGELPEIIATDQGTKMGIPPCCEGSGNQFLSSYEDKNVLQYFTVKS